jgi:hypothetical protein
MCEQVPELCWDDQPVPDNRWRGLPMAEFFGPLGVTNIGTFTDPQNPTRVAALTDVADLDTVAASR